jgi:hypothetical protein
MLRHLEVWVCRSANGRSEAGRNLFCVKCPRGERPERAAIQPAEGINYYKDSDTDTLVLINKLKETAFPLRPEGRGFYAEDSDE